jgi:hypothetical protein
MTLLLVNTFIIVVISFFSKKFFKISRVSSPTSYSPTSPTFYCVPAERGEKVKQWRDTTQPIQTPRYDADE